MDHKELIRVFENDIPFNRLLGFKVVELNDEFGLMVAPYQAALVGDIWRGALHGGVAASLADSAAGVTVWSRLTQRARLSTIDLRIDYLRPARKADLWCRASILRLGNQTASVAMVLYHDESEIVAEGRAVYNISRPRDEAG